MKTITVHASQTYPIWIGRGLLGQCGSYLKQQTKAQTAAVITDDHVDKYYGDIVTSSLEASGFRTLKFVFPHGEASKCSRTLNQIYDFLCENNITRTDCLVALGGGRFCGGDLSPWTGLSPDSHQPAGAGGFFCGRKDSHRPARRQEPGGRIQAAGGGAV